MRIPAPATHASLPQPTKGKLSLIFGQHVVRQADSTTKNNNNHERSRNVYENKQNVDILPPKSSGILVETTRVVGHFGTK